MQTVVTALLGSQGNNSGHRGTFLTSYKHLRSSDIRTKKINTACSSGTWRGGTAPRNTQGIQMLVVGEKNFVTAQKVNQHINFWNHTMREASPTLPSHIDCLLSEPS
jgi:hypothetical protein